MFNKGYYNKIIQLNEEFITATPERCKQIEQEIISMAPEDQFPYAQGLSEIAKLQSELKDNINKLVECASESEVMKYYKELNILDEKICNYAKDLGSELKRTDYGKILNQILEVKFGKK